MTLTNLLECLWCIFKSGPYQKKSNNNIHFIRWSGGHSSKFCWFSNCIVQFMIKFRHFLNPCWSHIWQIRYIFSDAVSLIPVATRPRLLFTFMLFTLSLAVIYRTRATSCILSLVLAGTLFKRPKELQTGLLHNLSCSINTYKWKCNFIIHLDKWTKSSSGCIFVLVVHFVDSTFCMCNAITLNRQHGSKNWSGSKLYAYALHVTFICSTLWTNSPDDKFIFFSLSLFCVFFFRKKKRVRHLMLIASSGENLH